MSRQSKLRNKRGASRTARKEGKRGHIGASGVPHKQSAPPWVRDGHRRPKAVREREVKLKAEQEAAAREAAKQRLREVADES